MTVSSAVSGQVPVEAMTLAESILDFSAEARKFQIDWITYEKSNFLGSTQLELLTSYLKGTPDARKEFLATHGVTFFTILINFMNKVSKIETLQFLLTWLDDILAEDPEHLNLLVQCSKRTSTPLYKAFLIAVETKDDLYVQHQANRILVKIITHKECALPPSAQQSYFAWVCKSMQSKEKDSAILTLSALNYLLRCAEYRRPFAQFPDSVQQLRAVLQLDVATYIQHQYLAMLCLWVMTFDSEVAAKLDQGGPHVIMDIAHLMKSSRKEKVIRMCFATFANLLTKPKSDSDKAKNAAAMISYKVLPFVQLRGSDDFDDEDVKNDLTVLKTTLEKVFDEMSTFDEYASEVSSGLLEWSPVHKSERFWRENAMRLNEERHKLIKILIQLLETSDNPMVLAVANHDLGEYVRHYPRGKQVLETLGGKKYIMKHMQNEDPAVRYEALIAVQKLMTQNWGRLGQKLQETMDTPK
eukprot:m.4946 g.4946  ORF g.4946 m.4946 type:complete len:470 (+) comp3144_c0_seq1:127-1536(+)